MKSRFRVRGDWRHGITEELVDVKALDIFLRILPWALAVEAIVRGWEIMRFTGLLLNMLPSSLRGQAGEAGFGFEFFGFTFFLAGITMLAGLFLRRFGVIISACLVGTASYLLLSASFLFESIFGDSGTGARGSLTFLLIALLWTFKGFMSASKKVFTDARRETSTVSEGATR